MFLQNGLALRSNCLYYIITVIKHRIFKQETKLKLKHNRKNKSLKNNTLKVPTFSASEVVASQQQPVLYHTHSNLSVGPAKPILLERNIRERQTKEPRAPQQHRCLKQVQSELHGVQWYIVANLSKRLLDNKLLNRLDQGIASLFSTQLSLQLPCFARASGDFVTSTVDSYRCSLCFKDLKHKQLTKEAKGFKLHYVRHSHNFLIGIEVDCQYIYDPVTFNQLALVNQICDILVKNCERWLSTRITRECFHIYTTKRDRVPFLGYYIRHSTITNKVHLLVNMNQVVHSLSDMGFCDRSGKPKPNFRYFQESQYSAIARVSSVLRGLACYYELAEWKRRCMTRCSYILTHSLAMMFAAKFKLGTRAKVFAIAGRNLNKPLSSAKRRKLKGVLYTKPSTTYLPR